MAKLKSGRSQRRHLERQLKKDSPPQISKDKLLFQIKYVWSETQVQQVVHKLPESTLSYFECNPTPKSVKEIKSSAPIQLADSLVKEIEWYSKIITKYAVDINLYIGLEKAFENNFLLGNYEIAKEILDTIEKSICVSQWSIEKRLLLAEYKEGFKKNKEVLSEIVDDRNNQLVNLMAQYQSIRIESNLSHFKYEEILATLLRPNDPRIQSYLMFKLNFFSNVDYSYKSFFLWLDNNSSIIDRYRLFINLLIFLANDKRSDKDLLNCIQSVAEELKEKVVDIRIWNLLLSLGSEVAISLSPHNIVFLEILDNYTKGAYSNVIKLSSKFLIENPLYFEIYELYVKSTIKLGLEFHNFLPSSSVAFRALQDIYSIISKNEQTTNSIISAHKTYSAFGYNSWTYNYFAFVNSEHAFSDPSIDYQNIAKSGCHYYNPALKGASNQITLKYLEQLQISKPESETIKFQISKYKNEIYDSLDFEIDAYRYAIYKAKSIVSQEDYRGALLLFKGILDDKRFIIQNKLPHNYIEVVKGLVACHIKLGDYDKAIEVTTEYTIDNPNVVNALRNEVLIEVIQRFDSELLNSNISHPIFVYQYLPFANNLWIAYASFLDNHELKYPHSLKNLADNFDTNKMIYFLRYVCRQDVYDSSYEFGSHDDLDNERIEICLFLADLDPKNAKLYHDEITSISRSLLIRKGIKQIDQSKIYVDIKGVKASLEKELKEDFGRSLNLVNLPLNQIEKIDKILERQNVIVTYYGKSHDNQRIEAKEENLKLTSYSRFELFTDMFFKVRDRFISSNEYGIDTYVSTRIRHGTLQGEIRSVFESSHLITKKETASGRYQANNFWLRKINIPDPQKVQKFIQITNNFSDKIDKLSEELKNKWLQIKTEKKQTEGLFDYSYSDNDLLKLFKHKYGAIENYPEFTDQVIEELWSRTEKNLAAIREFISDHMKNKALAYLAHLQVELEANFDRYQILEITRSITNCQTSIVFEFDKITQWFQRTNSKTINDFQISLPLDASLITVRRIYPRYTSLNPEISNNSLTLFDGEYFTQFSDIFQILFENITKHSHLDSNQLKVNIEISEVQDLLTITFKNNISSALDVAKMNQSISETKNLIAKSQATDRIRNEGGSGYLKIKRILQIDLQRNVFDIGISEIDESREFVTSIKFSTKKLQK
jgi:hypothetical protein